MKRFLKAADRWVEAREKWVVPVVAALLLAALVMNAFSRDKFDFGPYDGKKYESLGWRAAQAEHLLAEGNFNHAYWSPGWVVTIGTVYKIVGRRPVLIRVLLALCAVGSALLINHWTRRRGMPSLACLLAMILAVSSTLVFNFTTFLHYEVLLGFGLVVFSWMVFRGNQLVDEGRRYGYLLLIGSGLLFGYLSFFASKVVALMIVLPALQLLSGRKRHAVRTSLVAALCCW